MRWGEFEMILKYILVMTLGSLSMPAFLFSSDISCAMGSIMPRAYTVPDYARTISAHANPAPNGIPSRETNFLFSANMVEDNQSLESNDECTTLAFDASGVLAINAVNELKKLVEEFMREIKKNSHVLHKLSTTTEDGFKQVTQELTGINTTVRTSIESLVNELKESNDEETQKIVALLAAILQASQRSDEKMLQIAHLFKPLKRTLDLVSQKLEQLPDVLTKTRVADTQKIIAMLEKIEAVLEKSAQKTVAFQQENIGHKEEARRSGFITALVNRLFTYPGLTLAVITGTSLTLIRNYFLKNYSILMDDAHWSLYMPDTLVTAIKAKDEKAVMDLIDAATFERYAGLLDDLSVEKRRARFLIEIRKELELIESYTQLLQWLGVLNKVLRLPEIPNKNLRENRLKSLHALCLKHWAKTV